MLVRGIVEADWQPMSQAGEIFMLIYKREALFQNVPSKTKKVYVPGSRSDAEWLMD